MLTVILATLLAQGGPPLITDDPATPGHGRTELNVAFTVEKQRDLTIYKVPFLDFNYGTDDHTQLKVELPWVIGRSHPGPDASGLGNLLLGFKVRFLDQDQAGLAASFFPQGEIVTSARSRRAGLVHEHRSLLLPVEAAHHFGPVAVTGEAGYRFVQEDDDEWLWGIAVGYSPTGSLEIVGEIHGETAAGFRRGEMIWDIGLRIQLSDLNTILISAGRGIRGAPQSEPDSIGYLGLQFKI
jgi:hypothetical protein